MEHYGGSHHCEPPPKRRHIGEGHLLPKGWLACPPAGEPVGPFLPIKVPLGMKYGNLIPEDCRWTPSDVLAYCRSKQYRVGMVIDLTNTNRYYDKQEFQRHGLAHLKIPCRGRGQSPEPAAVNEVVYRVMVHMLNHPDALILLHCTHGFNRTGFMVVSTMMRLNADKPGTRVDKLLRIFAQGRPPGIYKDEYINDLFKFYHEGRASQVLTPPVPDWKGPDTPPEMRDEDEELVQENDPNAEKPNHEWKHDDPVGDPICQDEEEQISGMLYHNIMVAHAEHHNPRLGVRFPGSQPVSLARSNMGLIAARRYWVTWKADGTRYLLLIMKHGTYLIDRSSKVRRLQMRFPNPKGSQAYPVGPPLRTTILDGEMVVDEDVDGRKSRRFLVYDIMYYDEQDMCSRPFKERFDMIDKYVLRGRTVERAGIEQGKLQYNYRYNEEVLHVRRKEFWPICWAHKLIYKFIPTLCHEADGLIFQDYEDAYIPGTCNALLKWKFAHLNSVDFKLQWNPDRDSVELLLMEKRGLVPLANARLRLPEQDEEGNPLDYGSLNEAIIECSWEEADETWVYMRIRRDKETPNGYRVYQKVMQSIQDKLLEQELLEFLDNVFSTSPAYDTDRQRQPHGAAPPSREQLPPPSHSQQPSHSHPDGKAHSHPHGGWDPHHDSHNDQHRGNGDRHSGRHHGHQCSVPPNYSPANEEQLPPPPPLLPGGLPTPHDHQANGGSTCRVHDGNDEDAWERAHNKDENRGNGAMDEQGEGCLEGEARLGGRYQSPEQSPSGHEPIQDKPANPEYIPQGEQAAAGWKREKGEQQWGKRTRVDEDHEREPDLDLRGQNGAGPGHDGWDGSGDEREENQGDMDGEGNFGERGDAEGEDNWANVSGGQNSEDVGQDDWGDDGDASEGERREEEGTEGGNWEVGEAEGIAGAEVGEDND